METIIIHPKTKEEVRALKTIFKGMNIPFEKIGTSKKTYNQEFIAKIKKGDLDKKEGRFTSYSLEQLDEICK